MTTDRTSPTQPALSNVQSADGTGTVRSQDILLFDGEPLADTTIQRSPVSQNPELSEPIKHVGRSSSLAALAARSRELFAYRDLVRNLVVSELKARYKNSVLGFVWSLLNPLAMMMVFTIVFSVLWPNNDIEKYPLFLLCGLLPWNFFQSSVAIGINSIVLNGGLIKKVYFPREVLPVATVLAQLVNFLLAFVVLFAVLLVFRSHLSPWLWLLPVIILIQTCFTIGIVLILATVNVFYRDTVIVMEVIMLAWFFLTPVFYAIDQLPTSYEVFGWTLDVHRIAYIVNPMASLVNMYRDMLYYGYRTDPDFFLRTATTALVFLAFGYWFFTRHSHRFGEEV